MCIYISVYCIHFAFDCSHQNGRMVVEIDMFFFSVSIDHNSGQKGPCLMVSTLGKNETMEREPTCMLM